MEVVKVKVKERKEMKEMNEVKVEVETIVMRKELQEQQIHRFTLKKLERQRHHPI